jgi:hypothetical protein
MLTRINRYLITVFKAYLCRESKFSQGSGRGKEQEGEGYLDEVSEHDAQLEMK